MAFIPVPDSVQVTFRGTTGAADRPWSFSLWFRMEGFTQQNVANLLDYLENTWTDLLMSPEVWSGYVIRQIEAVDQRTEDGVRLVRNVNKSGDSLFVTPVSMSNALVVSFNAAKRGRWNQGRVFLPLIAENAADEHDVNPVWANAIRDVFRLLLTGLPDNWAWVVVSKVYRGQPRLVAAVADIVDAVVKRYVFGSQRRRLRRNK